MAHIGHRSRAQAQDVDETSNLDAVHLILRSAVGIDFGLYKKNAVCRHIVRRMTLKKIPSLEKYAQILEANIEEAQALVADIFRQSDLFLSRSSLFFRAFLRKQALAKLIQKAPVDPIRIWVAGCSTGEEVYSIAMLLSEELPGQASQNRIQIFGTDIQKGAVAHARAGIYTETDVAMLSRARLDRFFTRTDEGYQVKKLIRDLCVFGPHDLTRDFSFSRLDLISCRNVLTYMVPALQQRVLSMFHYSLGKGGFLFLGSKESIGAHSDIFAEEDPKHRLFLSSRTASAFQKFRSATGQAIDIRNEAEGLLLEQYAPPALVVDPDLHIVHSLGDLSCYLEPSTGCPDFHLLKMVRRDLVLDLRTAIQKSRKDGALICHDAVQFEHDGKSAAVRLEVQPLKKGNGSREDLLVVFRKVEPVGMLPGTDEGRNRRAAEKCARGNAGRNQKASIQERTRALIEEHKSSVGADEGGE